MNVAARLTELVMTLDRREAETPMPVSCMMEVTCVQNQPFSGPFILPSAGTSGDSKRRQPVPTADRA